MLEKLSTDATDKALKTAKKGMETLIMKTWSLLDAASAKRSPSQYLSDQAIRSIQGKE